MIQELLSRLGIRTTSPRLDDIGRTRRFFDVPFTSRRHAQQSPVERLVYRRLTSLVPAGRPDQTAVDLGCHWGRYTRFLAQTFGQVWGIDFATTAIASAPRAPNVRFHAMDLEDPTQSFPFERDVDLFVAIGLFELVRDPAALCSRLASAASSNCQVFVAIPNRRSIHYRVFRLGLWIARNLLGRRRVYIYNNGLHLDDLIRSMAAKGFRVQTRGATVGVPPSVLMRLPYVVQRWLLGLDGLMLSLCGGSYDWALLKRGTLSAGATDN